DPTGTRTYGYQDVHYFLTRGDGPWGELSWTYDKIGNRLSEIRDGEANVYQYLSNTAGGHNPKLTEINPGTEDSNRYFYDAAGNQTYRSEGATKQRFSYDAANRLSQILTDSPESAGAITQFRYDGRSFLDTATLAPFPGRPEQFTTTATYSSEGQLHHRATEEPRGAKSPRNAPDRVTASFVLYFAGRPVGTYDKVEETALGGEVSETTNLTFLTTDHLGTPVLTTKAGGNSAWGGGFEPFGTDYSGAQQAGVFLRFPGQWENEVWEGASDGDSLYYNVHRWYEHGTGRYSRPDPLGVSRAQRSSPNEKARTSTDVNLYSYVLQNPIVNRDPRGLAVTTIGCGASDDAKIQSAAAKADAASETCLPCQNRAPFRKKIRSQGTSDEITFECVSWNVSPTTGRELCGRRVPNNPNAIQITPDGLGGVPGCGCLQSTILHEVLHLLGMKQHDAAGSRFKAELKCFTCATN
ncbi:MAG: RHS repeat-associated core domain-containing protein, partial [Thermoanaerobaculia bacterium]